MAPSGPSSSPGALPTPFDYRLNPAFGVRFFGAALVALALVMFVATAVVAIAGWNADVLVLVLVLELAGVFTFGWWLRNRATVLHVDAEGYRVRLIRGAGVKAAAWSEVEDAATATPHGIPVVVLQLTGGRTTSIPVQALALDREEFVRELQRRLRDGQGLRPL